MTSPAWGVILLMPITAVLSKEIKGGLFWNQSRVTMLQTYRLGFVQIRCCNCGNSFVKSSGVTKQRKLQVMTFKKCVGNIR